MTDQNMEKGDVVYPNHQVTDSIGVKGSLAFLKGELATIDSDGYLVKLTSTKEKGLVQVKNAVTGNGTDGAIKAAILRTGSRALMSMPVDAKKGDLVSINGTNGTGNLVVVTAAAVDVIVTKIIGRVFGLYRNSSLKATAGDLGLVDMGAI